jgi:tRNA(fMet)-specific endonuclease VapC
MADTRILADTSIIIDFLRKKKKNKSALWNIKEISTCFMSSITLFELLSGAKHERHFEDIKRISNWVETIYFDDEIADLSAMIYRNLKKRNQLIEFRDIFIAATAKYHNLCLATLNVKHFERIENLTIFDIS